jgi:hypothetical protein
MKIETYKDQRRLVCRGSVDWKLYINIRASDAHYNRYWFPNNVELAKVLREIADRLEDTTVSDI